MKIYEYLKGEAICEVRKLNFELFTRLSIKFRREFYLKTKLSRIVR